LIADLRSILVGSSSRPRANVEYRLVLPAGCAGCGAPWPRDGREPCLAAEQSAGEVPITNKSSIGCDVDCLVVWEFPVN